jgi:hypothetical protein
MSASDPLIEACVAGLDLIPVEMAITATGAAIGTPPIPGAMQSQSVIVYCRRHANVERLITRVRSEFADAPTGVALSGLVSAVLNCAALFGVYILTETEVRILATETVAQMETELTQLQPAGGLPALNRSVQRDAAVAKAGVSGWQTKIFSCLAGGGKGRRYDRVVILYRVGMTALTASVVIIRTQCANTFRQFRDCILRWAGHGEMLTIRLMRHLSIRTGHAARRMAHRRRLYGR